MPEVSIIVPVCNAEKYLRSCLDSLLAQTLKDIEIICIDDGSTDGSGEILDSYGSSIKVLHLPNSGTIIARKRGVEKARGRYVFFVDADDELAPEACEKALAAADRRACDILQVGVEIVETVQRTPQERAKSEGYFNSPPRELQGREILSSCYLERTLSHNLIFRLFKAELVRKAFSFIPDVYSINETDLYAFFYIAAFARTFAAIKNRLYRYRYGCGISTRRFCAQEDFRRMLRKLGTLNALDGFVGAEFPGDEQVLRAAESVRKRMIENICVAAQLRVRDKGLSREALEAIRAKCGTVALVKGLAERFSKNPDDCAHWLRDIGAVGPCMRKGVRRVGLMYHHLTIGGIQRVIRALVDLLPSIGYEVVLFLEQPLDETCYRLPEGVEVALLAPCHDVKTPAAPEERIESLVRALGEHPVDVMYSHQYFSQVMLWDILVCKWVARIPFVLHYHSMFSVPLHVNPTARMFESMPNYARMCDGVVALSRVDAAYFRAVGARRAIYLPNPAPVSLREHLLAAPGDRRNQKQILWVGRIAWEKRPIDALYIFSRVHAVDSETRLVVVGGGNDLIGERMRKTVEKLGLSACVELVGPQIDVNRFYGESSLFLSTSHIEGFSMTSLEALAHGLPIVSYAHGQLELYRDNPTVRQVREGDVDGAAEAILAFLGDAGLADMRARARGVAEKFMTFDFAGAIRAFIGSLGEDVPREDAVPLQDVGIMMGLVGRGAAALQKRAMMCSETKLRRDFEEMRDSASFRIGRALTWLPRMVRDALLGRRRS